MYQEAMVRFGPQSKSKEIENIIKCILNINELINKTLLPAHLRL